MEPDNSIPETDGQKPQNPEQQIYYTLDLTRQYHNLLVSEDKAEQKEQTFYWDGNVAAMEEDERDSYYLQDNLGSPMQLMDEKGEIRETYGFDEFGRNLDHRPEKQIQPFGYTGYQLEAAGGLYFAQARRYDAGAGRFVSEDFVKGFIDFPFSLNHYVYCWNRPLDFVDLNGLWPSWSDVKNAVGKAGDAIVNGFNNAVDTAERFYEDHKEAIDTGLKIAGTVVVAGALVAGTICTGGAVGAICAGALAGGVIGMGVDATMQIANNGVENFSLDQMLISGAAGALSGALSFATANPFALFGGNAMINIGAYCATQKVHGEDISVAGIAISGIIGGVAGLLGGSSKNVTDLAQSALRHSQLSIMASEGGKETLEYIFSSVVRGMGRSTLSETGRYIATDKTISTYESVVCGE